MNVIKIQTQAEFDALPDNIAAKIQIVGELSKIDRFLQNGRVSVSGSAKIGSVFGSAKIDYVSGSAKIDSVSDSAKIDYVCSTASVNIYNDCSPVLLGFAVAWIFNKLSKPIKKSATAQIIIVESKDTLTDWINNNPVEINEERFILYKRVSADFKTQENTINETVWTVGQTITHPNWKPETDECGQNKFHACSRPTFCNEFRKTEGDRYIAIQVKREDLFAWKNPQYPFKIAFRTGTVLYECDEDGNKISPT